MAERRVYAATGRGWKKETVETEEEEEEERGDRTKSFGSFSTLFP